MLMSYYRSLYRNTASLAPTSRISTQLTLQPIAISLGYSSSTGALFGAIYNVASGVGRIGFGVFADILVGVRFLPYLAVTQLMNGSFAGGRI